jgi:two-component system, NarL family, invasion response regulator UvrY
MTRVLIADGHPVARAGCKYLLRSALETLELGEAANGTDALELLAHAAWDLLLMDICLPDARGVDLLHLARLKHPDLRILVLTGLPQEQFAHEALRHGATGFISKQAPAATFIETVRATVKGQTHVHRRLMLDARRPGPHRGGALHANLSPREFQIFCKLAAGIAATKAANHLSLSVKTISTYRSRILDKMGFKNNAQMTGYALRHGLIQ